MNLRRPLPAVFSVFALVVAGCGGDDGGSGTTTAASPPAAASGPGSALKISADPGGRLAYTAKNLKAPAGTLVIEFTNDASVPHDVKIEKDGNDLGGTDVVSKSKTTANVQVEAGEYTFYCSVGSHRGAGMEGTLVVE